MNPAGAKEKSIPTEVSVHSGISEENVPNMLPSDRILGSAKIACLLMFAIIIMISWLGSGTRAEFLMPMLWVSVAMFFVASFSARMDNMPVYAKVSFWSGMLVMLINAIQIANPALEYVIYERYAELQPLAHISWLPVSVKSDFFGGDALRSLSRIAAVFCVFMSAVLIFRWKRIARLCLVFFAVNVTAMSAWGIYQYKTGFPIMYDLFFSISRFYASFFLANAAGAFINLGLAANLALVFISARLPNIFLRIVACVFFLGSSAVCVVSCYESHSNGALAMSAVLCLVFAGACAYSFFRIFLSVRVSIFSLAIIAVLSCVGMCAAYGVASEKNPALGKRIHESMSSRFDIYVAASEVIKDNLIWGVGGDGARHYLPQELKQRDRKNELFVTAERVHSGFLEYLMEFGIIGFSAISVAGFAWFFQFFHKFRKLHIENLIIMAGMILFLFHSCFDIHLHIPSTMMAGAIMAVLAVSPLRKES